MTIDRNFFVAVRESYILKRSPISEERNVMNVGD